MKPLTTTNWLDITFLVLLFGAYFILPITMAIILVF